MNLNFEEADICSEFSFNPGVSCSLVAASETESFFYSAISPLETYEPRLDTSTSLSARMPICEHLIQSDNLLTISSTVQPPANSLLISGEDDTSYSYLYGKKREIDNERKPECKIYTFVPYDTSRLCNPPLRKTKRRRDTSRETAPFKCASCKRLYANIEHHFRRLRSNTPCRARLFHIKSGNALEQGFRPYQGKYQGQEPFGQTDQLRARAQPSFDAPLLLSCVDVVFEPPNMSLSPSNFCRGTAQSWNAFCASARIVESTDTNDLLLEPITLPTHLPEIVAASLIGSKERFPCSPIISQADLQSFSEAEIFIREDSMHFEAHMKHLCRLYNQFRKALSRNNSEAAIRRAVDSLFSLVFETDVDTIAGGNYLVGTNVHVVKYDQRQVSHGPISIATAGGAVVIPLPLALRAYNVVYAGPDLSYEYIQSFIEFKGGLHNGMNGGTGSGTTMRKAWG
ncbi:hypothetical protein GGX14DRAFT_563996 [Mycena pura]|uniref:Uncharacterized protein n=1 Tax=Mycena pura TaxID=153505 RepID=A0AAD6YC40_9AGAR|nr:hypothetical protein GGX14DRAFT_563996 [Mycena pura]